MISKTIPNTNSIITELPHGWELKAIGEVTQINPKLDKSVIPDKMMVSFVPMQAVGAGDGLIDVHILRPASEVKKGFPNFQEGDVLFAKITPCMENGKMAIVPKVASGYGFGSTEFHVLRPKNGLDPRYLYYFVSSQSVRKEAAHNMTGAVGQKRVATSYIANLEIPLAPPDQQRLIVAEIEKQFSRLDEAVANLKRVKANLKRYKAAAVKAAVEGHLVETEAELARRDGRSYETGVQLLQRILDTRRNQWKGKSKYKEPSAPVKTDLSGLPEGWVWTYVDQLVAHLTDGDHQAPPQTDHGIPFLVIGNVRNGEIDFMDSRFVGEVYYKRIDPYRQPKKGDLLYTLVGSYGIPVRVKTDQPFCIQRHMAILRPHKKSPMDYLALAMASDSVFKQATAIATGTAQKTVPLAGLRKIVIPLPPETEQARIVSEVERRLSLVREVETQINVNLQRAERVRQAILKMAFAGKLEMLDKVYEA